MTSTLNAVFLYGQGNSALHLACYYSKLADAKWLIQHGCDTNIRNKVS
jgi:ankyrin repeat protein